MRVKDFIELLKEVPEDYDVCLSWIVSDTDDGPYTYLLDNPIDGFYSNEDTKEIRLGISSTAQSTLFGTKL